MTWTFATCFRRTQWASFATQNPQIVQFRDHTFHPKIRQILITASSRCQIRLTYPGRLLLRSFLFLRSIVGGCMPVLST